MSPHEELPPELKAVEARLSSLAPRADTINSGRLMFQAGRASVERERRAARLVWPSAFAAVTAVAAVLLVMLIARPGPRVVERVVYAPADRTEPAESLDDLKPPAGPVRRESPDPVDRRDGRFPAPSDTAEHTAPDDGQNRRALFGPDERLASAAWFRPGTSTYPDLRNRLLIEGVDAWQEADPPSDDGRAESPLTYRSWTQQLLTHGSL